MRKTWKLKSQWLASPSPFKIFKHIEVDADPVLSVRRN